MTSVFLDTVGLLAVWDEDDQWHRLAVPVFLDLLAQRRTLITTPLVLAERANAAARRTYRDDVCTLRKALKASGRLIEPTQDEVESAWLDYELGAAGHASVVDRISFAAMHRLGITEAFTNDRHFVAAGFKCLF